MGHLDISDGANIRTIPCLRNETWGTQDFFDSGKTTGPSTSVAAATFGRDDKGFF
jgi:hypothetical protein